MITITIDRAVVEQALEALEAFLSDELRPYEAAKTSDALRAALAQQAEPVEPVATVTECEACFTPDVCQLRGTCDYYTASQMRIAAPRQQQAEPNHDTRAEFERWAASYSTFCLEREDNVALGTTGYKSLGQTMLWHAWQAALAQQAAPDHETRAELAEQQVVQLAEERDHYRNLWQKAQQAEPATCSNTFGCRCPKHFAVEQAEPVEPVAWMHNILEDNIIRHRPADLKRSPQNWTPLCKCADTPPQRKPLPKHDQHCVDVPGYGLMAVRLVRAVERAHGITDPQIEDHLARHGIPMPGDPK